MTVANQPHQIAIYATQPHDCPYLAERTARTAFIDPRAPLSPAVYDALLAQGLRRSGSHVYRPICPACSACRSLRIPVARFHPRRRHRRSWRRNSDVAVTGVPARFDPGHYRLFQRYVRARHPNGGMDETSAEDYRRFLFADWCDTELLEFRLNGELLAVAVTDRTPTALSAAYTFFEPTADHRSLGTLAILTQMERARTLGRHWLYLGYWIAECASMRYKAEFTPHEVFTPDGQWTAVDSPEDPRREHE